MIYEVLTDTNKGGTTWLFSETEGGPLALKLPEHFQVPSMLTTNENERDQEWSASMWSYPDLDNSRVCRESHPTFSLYQLWLADML
jgi:hypothetical protein